MKWPPDLDSLRRGISVVARIAKAKLKALVSEPSPPPEVSRLAEFHGFGDNPGRLRMFAHIPGSIAGRPVVVLLHGCGQDARQFAADSGWTECADRLRFVLVLPEQAEANRGARCFKWFQRAETARDLGEAGSIASMTHAAISRFNSDPRRVFVVGLSAGAAMAAALLAAYPDLFTAGAAVAGLPVGAARSGMQAILRMAAAGPDQSAENWAARARAVAPTGFQGPWPRISIWHGLTDTTVAPANGVLIAKQWRALHGLNGLPTREQILNGVRHQMWLTADGRPSQRAVELWSLPHFPHAYPVGTRAAPPGRFVEQAAVDATAQIARFLGLD